MYRVLINLQNANNCVVVSKNKSFIQYKINHVFVYNKAPGAIFEKEWLLVSSKFLVWYYHSNNTNVYKRETHFVDMMGTNGELILIW